MSTRAVYVFALGSVGRRHGALYWTGPTADMTPVARNETVAGHGAGWPHPDIAWWPTPAQAEQAAAKFGIGGRPVHKRLDTAAIPAPAETLDGTRPPLQGAARRLSDLARQPVS